MAADSARSMVPADITDISVPRGMEWLRRGIARGLGVLYTLNMEHKPAADTIRVTAEAFIGAILSGGEWIEERDAPRFAEAFRRLALRSEFPRPGHLLAALPPVPPVPLTAEQREARRKKQAEKEQQQKAAAEAFQRAIQPGPPADTSLLGEIAKHKFMELKGVCEAKGAAPLPPRWEPPIPQYTTASEPPRPLPPKEDKFARANWVRRRFGLPEFQSEQEYERAMVESRRLTETAQSKE